MSDIYAVIGGLAPVLIAFGRLMWWMGVIQARLGAIEQSLDEHARLLRGIAHE